MGLFNFGSKNNHQGIDDGEPLKWDATRDVVTIKKLICDGKWDDALEFADELCMNFKMVVYYLRNSMSVDDYAELKRCCDRNNIVVKIYYGNKETDSPVNARTLAFFANDRDSAKNFISTLDLIFEENFIPKYKEFVYDPITPDSAKADIICKFYTDKELINKVTVDGYAYIKKFALELGLNREDNPFITFLSKWQGSPLDGSALRALNDLYAYEVIDQDDVEGLDPDKILYNEDLYNHQVDRIKEMVIELKNK